MGEGLVISDGADDVFTVTSDLPQLRESDKMKRPPIDMLCDLSCFHTLPWKSFDEERGEWLGLQGERELKTPRHRQESKKESIERFLSFLIESFHVYLPFALQPLLAHGESDMLHAMVGAPEASVCNLYVRPLETLLDFYKSWSTFMVGVFMLPDDMRNTQKLSYGVARLFSYMVVNQAWVGVVTSGELTLFCKRNKTDSLLVSRPVHRTDKPWVGFGFILDAGRMATCMDTGIPKLKSSFNMVPLLEKVKEFCVALEVRKMNIFVNKLEVLECSELKGMYSFRSTTDISLIRAIYRGKKVMVKLRDLSSSFHDWEESVKKTIREVDVYERLHRCQGICIPRLVSFGFMCGGMFSYIMMSYERSHDSMVAPFTYEQHQAVASGARLALKRLHARGIAYGELEVDSVVLREYSKGKWSAKLVGFSGALVNQDVDCRAMVEDRVAMEEIVDYFIPDEAADSDA